MAGSITLSLGAKLLLGIGANLLLSSLFQPKPPKLSQTKAPDAGARRNNDAFDGFVNTTSIGTPVFLNYGLGRISGQFISGYVKTVNHGKNDLIEVGSYF